MKNNIKIYIFLLISFQSIQKACEQLNKIPINHTKTCFVQTNLSSPIDMKTILRNSIATALIMENPDATTHFTMAHYDVEHKNEHIAQLESIIQKEQTLPDNGKHIKATVVIAYPTKIYQHWFWSWFNNKKEEIPLYPTWQQDIIDIVKELKMPTEITTIPYVVGGKRGSFLTVGNNPNTGYGLYGIKWCLARDLTAYNE